MVYVWIQDAKGNVPLIRMLNGNLGLPFGFRLANETPEQAAIRIAKSKTGVLLSSPRDTHDGMLYSEIDVEQLPSLEGVVSVPMEDLHKRSDIEASHRELLEASFMI